MAAQPADVLPRSLGAALRSLRAVRLGPLHLKLAAGGATVCGVGWYARRRCGGAEAAEEAGASAPAAAGPGNWLIAWDFDQTLMTSPLLHGQIPRWLRDLQDGGGDEVRYCGTKFKINRDKLRKALRQQFAPAGVEGDAYVAKIQDFTNERMGRGDVVTILSAGDPRRVHWILEHACLYDDSSWGTWTKAWKERVQPGAGDGGFMVTTKGVTKMQPPVAGKADARLRTVKSEMELYKAGKGYLIDDVAANGDRRIPGKQKFFHWMVPRSMSSVARMLADIDADLDSEM